MNASIVVDVGCVYSPTHGTQMASLDFVPADHSSISFDMFGSEQDELWESHVLEGGISYPRWKLAGLYDGFVRRAGQ